MCNAIGTNSNESGKGCGMIEGRLIAVFESPIETKVELYRQGNKTGGYITFSKFLKTVNQDEESIRKMVEEAEERMKEEIERYVEALNNEFNIEHVGIPVVGHSPNITEVWASVEFVGGTEESIVDKVENCISIMGLKIKE